MEFICAFVHLDLRFRSCETFAFYLEFEIVVAFATSNVNSMGTYLWLFSCAFPFPFPSLPVQVPNKNSELEDWHFSF